MDSISTVSSTVSSFTSRSSASLINSSSDSVREIRETENSSGSQDKKEEDGLSQTPPAAPTSSENESGLKRFVKRRLSGIKLKVSGFVKSLLKLFTNFRYVLLIVILSFECVIISIFTHYMILYSQHIYKISNSKSSIMIGGIIVPAAIVGA